MTTALVIITDGRWDYLGQCLASAHEHLDLDWFDHRYLIDDSGEPMAAGAPLFETVAHGTRKGLGASVRTAWAVSTDADWVFHLEEDFTFTRDVPLDRMRKVLERNPYLAQMVLKRQPWSPAEIEAGDMFIGGDYTQATNVGGAHWVEHTRGFSFNPCLIPRWCRPPGAGGTETEVTEQLGTNPNIRFAFWGRTDDDPACTHIGVSRSPQWVS